MKSKSSGKVYVVEEQPMMSSDRFTCKQCSKRCKTNQALIAHSKTHDTKLKGTQNIAKCFDCSYGIYIKKMPESDTDGSDETKIVPARNRYR